MIIVLGIIGLALIFGIVTIINKAVNGYWGDARGILSIVSLVLLGLVLMGLGLARCDSRYQANPYLAEYHQAYQGTNDKALFSEMSHTDKAKLIDDIASYNRNIAWMKTAKESLWLNWFVSDYRFEELQPIDIENLKTKEQ